MQVRVQKCIKRLEEPLEGLALLRPAAVNTAQFKTDIITYEFIFRCAIWDLFFFFGQAGFDKGIVKPAVRHKSITLTTTFILSV